MSRRYAGLSTAEGRNAATRWLNGAHVYGWFLKMCESDPDSARLVEQAIDLLAEQGPSLGRPLVDTPHGSRLPNLKELRPGSRERSEIRMWAEQEGTERA